MSRYKLETNRLDYERKLHPFLSRQAAVLQVQLGWLNSQALETLRPRPHSWSSCPGGFQRRWQPECLCPPNDQILGACLYPNINPSIFCHFLSLFRLSIAFFAHHPYHSSFSSTAMLAAEECRNNICFRFTSCFPSSHDCFFCIHHWLNITESLTLYISIGSS